jgi:hypothetical protein
MYVFQRLVEWTLGAVIGILLGLLILALIRPDHQLIVPLREFVQATF